MILVTQGAPYVGQAATWLEAAGVKVRQVDVPGPFNFSRKVNAGARAASADILFLLNDDAVVEGWEWPDLVAELLADPKTVGVGPLILNPDRTINSAGDTYRKGAVWHVGEFDLRYRPGLADVDVHDREVRLLTAAALLVRRSDLAEIGGMDEAFPASYGDCDLCVRLTQNGRRLVCTPRFTVVHEESSTRNPVVGDVEARLLIGKHPVLLGTDPTLPPVVLPPLVAVQRIITGIGRRFYRWTLKPMLGARTRRILHEVAVSSERWSATSQGRRPGWFVRVLRRPIYIVSGLIASFAWKVDARTAGVRSAILSATGAIDPRSPRALLYVHFSRDGSPTAWEAACLTDARASGIGVCVVVNSRRGAVIVRRWATLADLVIVRANRGRDLAAYRDGIRLLRGSGYGGPLALANGTVFWRPGAFSELFDAAEALGADVVGATSSAEGEPHLQTFWLRLSPAVSEERLQLLIDGWRDYRTRGAAIRYGELPSTRRAELLGYSTAAVFPYDSAVAALRGRAADGSTAAKARRRRAIRLIDRGRPLNPTQFMWSELLGLGFPGIKRDLLTMNPLEIEDQADIPATATGYGFDGDTLAAELGWVRGGSRVRRLVGL